MKTFIAYILTMITLWVIFLPIVWVFCPTGISYIIWMIVFYLVCITTGGILMSEIKKCILTKT